MLINSQYDTYNDFIIFRKIKSHVVETVFDHKKKINLHYLL